MPVRDADTRCIPPCARAALVSVSGAAADCGSCGYTVSATDVVCDAGAGGEQVKGGPGWPCTTATDGESKIACATSCNDRYGCTYYTWSSDKGCRTYTSCSSHVAGSEYVTEYVCEKEGLLRCPISHMQRGWGLGAQATLLWAGSHVPNRHLCNACNSASTQWAMSCGFGTAKSERVLEILESRLLDQVQAPAPYTPPFGGHSRNIPQVMGNGECPAMGYRCVCMTGIVRHKAEVQSKSQRVKLFSDMS